MGSCHSDLKGEKQSESTTEPAPQPIRKVQTNFSTVDYDTGASTRRDTVYAPNEVIREDKPEEFPPVAELASGEPETIQNRNSATISPETRLTTDSTNNQNLRREPYRDIDNDNLNSPISPINNHTTIPAVATTTAFSSDVPTTHYNPTTAPEDMGLFSKKKSSLEQPAPGFLNDSSSTYSDTVTRDKDNGLDVAPGQVQEKKSLYHKYQQYKRGTGIDGMSDEDLMKYTGKTRAELDDMAKTTPGVAGNQYAGSITAGGTSGIGLTGVGGGLGGWGREGSKDPVIR